LTTRNNKWRKRGKMMKKDKKAPKREKICKRIDNKEETNYRFRRNCQNEKDDCKTLKVYDHEEKRKKIIPVNKLKSPQNPAERRRFSPFKS